MATYRRAMPRDLFNEAKLLKCMGRLELQMLDYGIDGLNRYHNTMDNDGFEIAQDPSDGSIYISNLKYSDNEGNEVTFKTALNSKENYPLIMEYKDSEYCPFNEQGEYQLSETLFTEG